VKVLDLCAGSGAFALEALSRGAASATAVEKDARAAAVIRSNSDALGLTLHIIKADVSAVLNRLSDVFDVVFLDPPYDVTNDTIEKWLQHMCDGKLVAEGSVVVVERSARTDPFSVTAPLSAVDERNIGETRVYTLVC